MRHRVSAFAIRRPRPILVATIICAIVAAVFGSRVVPHLTSQTGSPTAPSVIAEHTIRNANGINVTDDVVILVTPNGGLHSAAGAARVAWVKNTLMGIKGIAKIEAPVFKATPAQVRRVENRIVSAKIKRARAAGQRAAAAQRKKLMAAATTARSAVARLRAVEAKAKRTEAALKADATATKAAVASVKTDATNTKAAVAMLKTDIANAKAAAATLRVAVAKAKAAAASLKAAAATLQADEATAKADAKQAKAAGAEAQAAAADLQIAETNLQTAEANLQAAEEDPSMGNLQAAEAAVQTAEATANTALVTAKAAEAAADAAAATAKADATTVKTAASRAKTDAATAKSTGAKAKADASAAKAAAATAQAEAATAKTAAANLKADTATAKTDAENLKAVKAQAERQQTAANPVIAQARAAKKQLEQVENADRAAARRAARKVAQAKAEQAKIAHKRIVTKPKVITSSQLVSRDGKTAIVVAQYYANADNNAVSNAVTKALGGHRDIQIGGYGITIAKLTNVVDSDLTRAELIAFTLLLIVGLWVFRSVVATLVPLTIGAMTIGTALLGLRVANHYEHLSEYVLNIVMGVGLGLAIDYSLFIISRYREEAVIDGYGPASLQRAMDHAGRTVAFSAVTVAAALSSLLVFPQRFLVSMGIGSAITVLISAFAALVVLPAMLSWIGPRIDNLAPKSWHAKTALAATDPTANVWYRLTRRVIRRPVVSVVGVLVIVGFALSGAFHAHFASADSRTLPASYQVHSVYQQLLDRFNPNLTRQLDVAWVGSGGASVVSQAATQIKHLQNAVSVGTPVHVGGDVWKIPMSTRTGSFTDASSRLVTQIRDLPSATIGGGHLLVGGGAADFYDLKHNVIEHMPLALTIVGLVVLLIVFLMTDSVVLAVKTLLINAMNVAAVIGALVWVFQYGHFQKILQFRGVGSLDITQPILIIMISFALSTDYGVFLLARIKEEHDNGRNTDDAIAYGLGRVGRVITYAAILLCVALGAFATSRVVVVKEIGVGAAFAIVLDATLIRAILVPAAMKLFGPLNWWSPSWTRPILCRVHGTAVLRAPLLPATATIAPAASLALPAGPPASTAIVGGPATNSPAASRPPTKIYDRYPGPTLPGSIHSTDATTSSGRPARTTRRRAPNLLDVALLTSAAIGLTSLAIGLATAILTLIKGLCSRSGKHTGPRRGDAYWNRPSASYVRGDLLAEKALGSATNRPRQPSQQKK